MEKTIQKKSESEVNPHSQRESTVKRERNLIINTKSTVYNA